MGCKGINACHSACGPGFGLYERNKVDGSLTLFPVSESHRELSGTGPRADLYCGFGVQRNLRDLCPSKRRKSFPGTGLQTS